MSKNIIHAAWLDEKFCHCEYCSANDGKTYLPLNASTLNPEKICQDCAKKFNLVGWYDNERSYYLDLDKLNHSKE